MTTRVRALAVVLAVIATTLTLVTSFADATTTSEGGRVGGEAAITRLGGRLTDVAGAHGMTGDDLRERLRTDPTLQVDDRDDLLYVDRAAPAGAAAAAASSTATPFDPSIPASDAFLLHSRPGAAHVIVLDFDGLQLTGTAWNGYVGGNCYAEPYDLDGSPAFSALERANIISVWKRVAEDYAPFDVDVTTEDPGYAAVNRADLADGNFGTRLLVTNSVSACPNGRTLYASLCPAGCGGVAYVGVYDEVGANHDFYQPAIVFQNGTNGTNGYPKFTAEATSHEVGHHLGLDHDGTATSAYYGGHGSWAPIMGIGYDFPITQWSKGEYPGANNTQDDFVVATQNGLPLAPDDHGDTAATATVLTGTTVSAAGVIGASADVDAFVVQAPGGPVTFTVEPAPTAPDLDVRLELRDASGTLVASSDPPSGGTADTATGMAATIAVTVPSGTYTLLVDGVGSGDPAGTGYSDYGSVGRYRLTGNVAGTAATNQPPVARLTAGQTTGPGPLVVPLDGSASSDPEGGTLTYAWTFGDGTGAAGATVTHTYGTTGTYTVELTVTDPQGLTGTATTTVTVSAPRSTIDVAGVTMTAVRSGSSSVSATATVTVRNTAGAAVGGATVTGRWYVGSRTVVSGRSATTGRDGVVTLSSGTLRATRGTVVRFCATGLALPGTTWTPDLFSPAGQGSDCVAWTVV